MALSNSYFIKIPQIIEKRGKLSFIEGNRHVPFEIRRIFYIYDVPEGFGRGGHAHRELEQLFIAMAGSFDIVLDDGSQRVRHTLSCPQEGLYVGPGIWCELENFSPGAVCVVLASMPYEESDYLRNYNDFLKFVEGKHS